MFSKKEVSQDSQEFINHILSELSIEKSSSKPKDSFFQYAGNCCENLLSDFPESEEVLELTKRILDVFDMKTSDPLFQMLQGNIFKRDGRLQLAAQCFYKAFQKYDQYIKLPEVPQDFLAPVKALRALEEIYDLSPNESLGMEIISRYNNLDRIDLAVEHTKKVMAHFPNSLNAKYMAAGLYLKNGEHSKGVNMYKQFIAKNPKCCFSYYAISHSLGFVPDDEFIEKAKKQLNVNDLSDKIMTYFTLGRCYHLLGDYQEAIKYYRSGNKLENLSFGAKLYSVFEKDMESLKALQDADHSTLFDYVAKTSKQETFKPIFILGMPRSGTSLVERILASHQNADDLASVYPGGENLFLEGSTNILKHNNLSPKMLTPMRTFALDAMRKQYDLDDRDSVRFVTIKTPQYFHSINMIQYLFPDAPIIHCKRDPMDTCMSLYARHMGLDAFHMAFKSDLNLLGKYYCQYYQPYMELWDRILPKGRIHTVSYEDIVTNTEQTVKQMLDYCSLEWSPSCLRHEKADVPTLYEYGTAKPIYKSSLGSGKKYQEYVPELSKWF